MKVEEVIAKNLGRIHEMVAAAYDMMKSAVAVVALLTPTEMLQSATIQAVDVVLTSLHQTDANHGSQHHNYYSHDSMQHFCQRRKTSDMTQVLLPCGLRPHNYQAHQTMGANDFPTPLLDKNFHRQQ